MPDQAVTTQVLAADGQGRAVAFDAIDRAPEERARGITINSTCGVPAHPTPAPSGLPHPCKRRPGC